MAAQNFEGLFDEFKRRAKAIQEQTLNDYPIDTTIGHTLRVFHLQNLAKGIDAVVSSFAGKKHTDKDILDAANYLAKLSPDEYNTIVSSKRSNDLNTLFIQPTHSEFIESLATFNALREQLQYGQHSIRDLVDKPQGMHHIASQEAIHLFQEATEAAKVQHSLRYSASVIEKTVNEYVKYEGLSDESNYLALAEKIAKMPADEYAALREKRPHIDLDRLPSQETFIKVLASFKDAAQSVNYDTSNFVIQNPKANDVTFESLKDLHDTAKATDELLGLNSESKAKDAIKNLSGKFRGDIGQLGAAAQISKN